MPLIAVGDSKTVGDINIGTDWKVKLSALYNPIGVTATFNGTGPGGAPCLAFPGWGTENVFDAVDAFIAAIATIPNIRFILYTLGTNDGVGYDETTWKTQVAYIWDAFHIQWPNIKVLVDIPLSQAGGTTLSDATMTSWFSDLQATRPWAITVFHEKDFLFCPADISDCAGAAVHENSLGADKVAQEWYDAIELNK